MDDLMQNNKGFIMKKTEKIQGDPFGFSPAKLTPIEEHIGDLR